MSDDLDNLVVSKSYSVLTVSLKRPERRNALSRSTLRELQQVFEDYAGDDSIRAAVVTASGDNAFAAGGDLKDFDAIRSEKEADALFCLANRALTAVRRFPSPTLAALNGTAIGGGAELAMACDFRVAAPHATIGFVQASLAITSGFGGGVDLMRRIGPTRAMLHMLRAQALDVGAAKELGLIDDVADPKETLAECVERFLAPIMRPPVHVVRALKRLAIAERDGLPRADSEDIEREGFAHTWAHPDHWAALERAFSSKKLSK